MLLAFSSSFSRKSGGEGTQCKGPRDVTTHKISGANVKRASGGLGILRAPTRWSWLQSHTIVFILHARCDLRRETQERTPRSETCVHLLHTVERVNCISVYSTAQGGEGTSRTTGSVLTMTRSLARYGPARLEDLTFFFPSSSTQKRCGPDEQRGMGAIVGDVGRDLYNSNQGRPASP